MVCVTLLFTVILTVCKAIALHCSNQQLPGSGDDMPDVHQATALQYCLSDNCTIIRTDTREELDIVYTTDSVLIVTAMDAITSLVIVKLVDELPCITPNNKALEYDDGVNILVVVLSSIIMVVSCCTAVIHLLVKQLHSLVGKLLILYSFSVVCMCITVNALFFARFKNTHALCDTIAFVFKLASISLEAFATCILTHLAYVMYRGSKLKPEMSKQRANLLLKCYIAYEVCTVLLVLLFVILYNLSLYNNIHVFLPNDHCRLNVTAQIVSIPNTFNKAAQILMFLVYLCYAYKLKKTIHNAGIPSRQQSQLNKIAIPIGATIGVSHFIYILYLVYNLPVVELCFGVFFIQQCVIMVSSLSIKKMHQLCKFLPWTN